jgi:hypothetical protein
MPRGSASTAVTVAARDCFGHKQPRRRGPDSPARTKEGLAPRGRLHTSCSPISRRGAGWDIRPARPICSELRFGMNSGAAPGADGAARRRLPIAPLVLASKHPALSLSRPSGHPLPCRPHCSDGRVAAAPEFAAAKRPLCEAKRQPLIEDCDVRPRELDASARAAFACSRSTAQQTATTAVGLELGSDDGLDGTIGFDGTQSRRPGQAGDRNARNTIAPPDVDREGRGRYGMSGQRLLSLSIRSCRRASLCNQRDPCAGRWRPGLLHLCSAILAIGAGVFQQPARVRGVQLRRLSNRAGFDDRTDAGPCATTVDAASRRTTGRSRGIEDRGAVDTHRRADLGGCMCWVGCTRSGRPVLFVPELERVGTDWGPR